MRASLLALLLLSSVAFAQPPCPGDCDGDGATTPDEVAQAIGAIFDVDGAACAAADLDDNGTVTAAELLRIHIAIAAPPDGCAPPRPRSEWIELDPLPGGPRQEVGVAALDDRVYVIGGLTDTGATSAVVEVLNGVSGSWLAAAADLPAPRHHVGAASAGGFVYVIGGFRPPGFTPAAEVYRYDPAQDAWTAVASLPQPNGALAAAELDGRLHAVGGQRGASVTDHHVYDPDTDTWTPLAPLPDARNHLAAVSLDGFLYAVGGRGDGSGADNTAALDRYDPARDMWETLSPMPTARSGIAAAVIDGRIIVMGGEVNAANPPTAVFVDVEIYDPATDRWTALEPMDLPRHGIGAATVGDLIYVPGGATRAGFAATAYTDAVLIR